MTILKEILLAIKELALPGGQVVNGLLLALALFGLYVLATGLAGLIWPMPLPVMSETERVEREVAAEREELRSRLRSENPVYKLAFLEQNLRPLVEQVGHLFAQTFNRLGLGKSAHGELERKLDLLGTGETVAGFYGQKFASGVVLVAVGICLQMVGILELSLIGLIAAFGAGFMLPSLTLSRKVRRMREDATNQLPGFIDLLSINVQAGMGLEGAMLKVAKSGGSGTLSTAVRRAFSEAQYRNLLAQSKLRNRRTIGGGAAALVAVGVEGETLYRNSANSGRFQLAGGGAVETQNLTLLALSDMAERFRVPELDDFVAALETADRQGVPVTETLLGLAGVMREKRRARLIEAGSKSMVRMLFPVALFIMPAFLLLLLTPALIQFLQLGN
ncbi:MAG TPA: type II secretion system F family protein [Chloroflexia bacterium]|nr:type II secretion system F family protein [Chloroflexia bacterium]